MIPGVPTGCEHHKLRLESGGIVKRADIDAEHDRLRYRLVVQRRAAGPAEPLQFLLAGIRSPQRFGHGAGDAERGTRKYHDRRMSAAGIPLTVAALTLKASNGGGRHFVTDFAASTTARVARHVNLHR